MPPNLCGYFYKSKGDRPADVYGQVGAGIVADSQPDKEWDESLQKAQARLQALQIIDP